MAVPAFRALIFALLSLPLAAGARPLDRARVHGLYEDGEFAKVLAALDAYVKGRCGCGRADSVFAEKHLAVVLAANPGTRELGRYHMFRLLDLAPDADLLDMFVGEEVDAVFAKVRKEHGVRLAEIAPPRAAAPRADWTRPALPAAAPAARPVTHARRWDDLTDAGSAPAPRALVSVPAPPPPGPAFPEAVPATDSARPAWKEPALWIGGGAALAAVAFTLWRAGADGPAPKTYAVPASLPQ